MARGINKVIIVGNLGNDPETRYMPSGSAVTNLTVATNESWKDKATGEQKDRTEWHKVAMFNRLAEVAAEYLRKGSQVYIEGKLRTRKWQDKNGQDRWTTEIVADEMQMLGGRGGAGFGPDFGASMSDVFEDIFGDFMGGGGRGRERSSRLRGADLRYNLEITLEEAFAGRTVDIDVPTLQACWDADRLDMGRIRKTPCRNSFCTDVAMDLIDTRYPLGIEGVVPEWVATDWQLDLKAKKNSAWF